MARPHEFLGLFRGHPAKPYYKELDAVLHQPREAVANKAIAIGRRADKLNLALDDW